MKKIIAKASVRDTEGRSYSKGETLGAFVKLEDRPINVGVDGMTLPETKIRRIIHFRTEDGEVRRIDGRWPIKYE